MDYYLSQSNNYQADDGICNRIAGAFGRFGIAATGDKPKAADDYHDNRDGPGY
jgi:hypothetical protein